MSYTSENEFEQAKAKLIDDFHDYDSAVKLIASLQEHFSKLFSEGKQCRRLVKFDRFGAFNGKTPDFVARFEGPYFLIGEHKKTLKSLEQARQVVEYALCGLPICDDRPQYDVLAITDITVHASAARAVEDYRSNLPKGHLTPRPIVVLGSRHVDNSRKHYFDLMHHDDPGNGRFSDHNTAPQGQAKNLNVLFVEPEFQRVEIDAATLVVAGKVPVINDHSPVLYSVIRFLVPGVNRLLNLEEREACLRRHEKLEKTWSRDDINTCEDHNLKGKIAGYILEALKALKEAGFCRESASSDPKKRMYILPVHRMIDIEDPVEYYADILAKAQVKLSKAAVPKKHKAVHAGQPAFPEMEN
jgi:hypothetical protein